MNNPNQSKRVFQSPLRHSRTLFLFLSIVCVAGSFQYARAQNPNPVLKFGLPVEGELDKDFWIVNYVDNNVDTGVVRDYRCGAQTYDGHQGTDFALRSFRQMDSGVYAIAAAAGRVIAVVDTVFDRNKSVDRSLGYGNYVAIEHPEGCVTYYAHLRKASAIVRIGDVVRKGQRLGLIGSSGTSEDPHLHFEVWLNVDPFVGNCATRSVRWEDQPSYASTFALLDADVTTWPPSLDTLRERPPTAGSISKQDTSVTFWSLQQHVDQLDNLNVTWRTPDDELWFSDEFTIDRSSTYYYWWTWIRRPTIVGRWKVEYRRNNILVATRTFDVDQSVSVEAGDPATPCTIQRFGDVVRCNVTKSCTLQVYDLLGRRIGAYALPVGTSAHIIDVTGVVILEIFDGDRPIARTVAIP